LHLTDGRELQIRNGPKKYYKDCMNSDSTSDLLLPAALKVVIDNIFYFNWLICPPQYARKFEETERGE